jgi:hypothetical protein
VCWEDPPTEDLLQFPDAVAYCDALVLDGVDDWTVPNITNLRGLARGCVDEPPMCLLYDPDHLHTYWAEGCAACPLFEGPGQGGCYVDEALDVSGCVENQAFWSTSQIGDYSWPDRRWVMNFDRGYPTNNNVETPTSVRCVRPML